ncbi:MAG: hypothetical protein IKA99_05975 [Clostridia bacterium]|nr:hypothetical protein [Clostridia bacterium]
MPRFFEGFLLVLMIFAFCVGFAIIVKASLLWLEDRQTPPSSPEQSPPKIYLVKQTQNRQVPVKKRKRRSPKIAFEGLILKSEQVSLGQEKNENDALQTEKKINF